MLKMENVSKIYRTNLIETHALRDFSLEIAEGDFVAIHFISTGTNEGSFLGNPPTGKQIHVNEMTIYRIAEGKIVEQWLLPDLLSSNQQLGLISQSE